MYLFLFFHTALLYYHDSGQVTALAVPDSTSVRVTWREWNQNIDHGVGRVAHYKACWKTNSTNSSADFKISTQTSITITDLSPQTTYTFAVSVVKTYQLLEGPRSITTSAITECVGMYNILKACYQLLNFI